MKLIRKAILAFILAGVCNVTQAFQMNDCLQAYKRGDYQNAVKLCLEPAKRGDELDQMVLMHSYGNMRNYSQQLKWAKKLAAKGNVYGLNILGSHYFTGVTIKRDHEKAKKLWSQACEAGFSLACESLQKRFN